MLNAILDLIPGRKLARTMRALDEAAVRRTGLGYDGLAFAGQPLPRPPHRAGENARRNGKCFRPG